MADAEYTDEIWKTIPFAPDYAVSNCGRVMRAVGARSPMGWNARPGHILRPSKRGHNRSYWGLCLIVDGKKMHINVHKAVAHAFHGEPPTTRHVVAHGDGNGLNNHSDNIRWATQSENLADRLLHGTHDRGERNANSKLTENDVRAIRASPLPESKLAPVYGVALPTIGKIKRREAWAWLD